jgi:hypothetical protein
MFLSSLLCLSLVAVSHLPLQKLTELQMEMSYLVNKREMLLRKSSDNLHQEVNAEVTSMQEMLDFRWGEFVSKLKNAKKYENMNREDEEELHLIDLRLSQLFAEAQHLIDTRDK